MPYLSTSTVEIHYEEAIYQVYAPLTRVAFVYNGLTHTIVEAAKVLGGSFKLVTLAPKTVREMTRLLRET